MRECLRDHNLLSVYYDEGAVEDLTHLETCSNCTARYRRLVHDLELIGQALERLPAALPARRQDREPWLRRVVLAATLAAGVVMVTSIGVWQWRDAHVNVQRQRTDDENEILRFLADASTGLSAGGDGEMPMLPLASDRADRDGGELEGQDGSVDDMEGI